MNNECLEHYILLTFHQRQTCISFSKSNNFHHFSMTRVYLRLSTFSTLYSMHFWQSSSFHGILPPESCYDYCWFDYGCKTTLERWSSHPDVYPLLQQHGYLQSLNNIAAKIRALESCMRIYILLREDYILLRWSQIRWSYMTLFCVEKLIHFSFDLNIEYCCRDLKL